MASAKAVSLASAFGAKVLVLIPDQKVSGTVTTIPRSFFVTVPTRLSDAIKSCFAISDPGQTFLTLLLGFDGLIFALKFDS